jgi:hypothetical protein
MSYTKQIISISKESPPPLAFAAGLTAGLTVGFDSGVRGQSADLTNGPASSRRTAHEHPRALGDRNADPSPLIVLAEPALAARKRQRFEIGTAPALQDPDSPSLEQGL